MSKLKFNLSISLDGYAAGPRPTLEDPLGEGGEQLHEWAVGTRSFQEMHGRSGGDTGVDDELMGEMAAAGATIMGRNMYSGGEGPWESDPRASGWWGDDPPFHHPVFVLTHHEREPLEMQGGTTFTFVTDGIESALEQARRAAGDGDVAIGGGAQAIQQYLRAGLVDEFDVHVVPVLLGGGVRLFDGLGADAPKLERTRLVESPTGVVHLRYRAL
jgi:dihydrofolate reductase